MARTRVKVCGITRPEDGLAAAELGVDAIGLVFYPPSGRFIDVKSACSIVDALPPFITSVGLFLDARPEYVREILAAVRLDLLQFHGTEDRVYCEAFEHPYIKAIPMAEDLNALEFMELFPSARGFLLDSHRAGSAGGSGTSFDWSQVPEQSPRPLILAGGLNPQNVVDAVAALRPYAVDVSSGVEVEKGIKDAELIAAFMRGVERGEGG